MKKTILKIALAFGMALPMSGMATADAVQYMVGRDYVSLKSRDRNGRILRNCVLKRETKVNILQRWYDTPFLIVEVTDGPHRGCRGHVIDTDIVRVPVYSKKVFTAGRWGNAVPVFYSRGVYFSARTSMDRNGHYNGQFGRVACMLAVGTSVDFTPYKNWGVGEVIAGNCRGWMDREVIR